jgi:hypothetical protein
MNSFVLFGQVVSAPKYRQADEHGAAKTTFVVETQTKLLPLRFAAMCFGETAEQSRYLTEGVWIVATGKLEGGYDQISGKATMTFFIREFSLLEPNSREEQASSGTLDEVNQ